MARPCSVLLVWILCAFGLGAQERHHPSEQLDLAGEWRLNESLSDKVPPLPGEAMALARASGQVRTGTRRAGLVRGPDPRGTARVRNALRSAIQAAIRLRFVHTGGTVALTDADGRTMSFVPDGRETRHEEDGVQFTSASRWNAPILTISREYEDGTTMIVSFASFDDPRQLVATTTIHNSRTVENPVTLRRVYEAVVEGDPDRELAPVDQDW